MIRNKSLAEVAMQEAMEAIGYLTKPLPSDDSSTAAREERAAKAMMKAIRLTVDEMPRS